MQLVSHSGGVIEQRARASGALKRTVVAVALVAMLPCVSAHAQQGYSVALDGVMDWGTKVEWSPLIGVVADGFYSGDVTVPSGYGLNITRSQPTVRLGEGALWGEGWSKPMIYGAPGSNAYTTVTAMWNYGAGTVAPLYSRCMMQPGATGYCVAEKLAVRGTSTSSVTIGQSIQAGPYVSYMQAFAGDNMQGDTRYGVVFFETVDVGVAVHQWNMSPASLGADYVRVLSPGNAAVRFRITNDGDIVWNEASSLKAELAALRAQVDVLMQAINRDRRIK